MLWFPLMAITFVLRVQNYKSICLIFLFFSVCPAQCKQSCSLMVEDTCCHRECIGGCYDTDNTSSCVACKNFFHQGTCVPDCPDGYFEVSLEILAFEFILNDHQACRYGGRRQAGPPSTHDFRPAQPKKKKNFRLALCFITEVYPFIDPPMRIKSSTRS